MNGYIKKQALMDYCSNQVTRTIDLNDIARFPISEVFTKDEVIAMLKDLQSEIEKMQSVPCDYHGDWCIDRDMVCRIVQQKIDDL